MIKGQKAPVSHMGVFPTMQPLYQWSLNPDSQEKCVKHFQTRAWELKFVNLLNNKNVIAHTVTSFKTFSVSCSLALLLIPSGSRRYELSLSSTVTSPLLPTNQILFVSWSEIQLIKLSLCLKFAVSISNLKGVQKSLSSPLLTVLEILVRGVLYLCLKTY